MPEEMQATVLTVDDNDAIRYSLSRYLREGGYRVVEARTGSDALSLARQDPALITLDINLPDMDGFGVARRLKAAPATRDIPVLHISASFVDAEHKVRGLEGGADAYLSEPISQQELLATVRALMRLRQAQKEAQRQAADAEKARAELKKTMKVSKIAFLNGLPNCSSGRLTCRNCRDGCSKLKTTSDGGFPANSMTVQANCWLLSNSTSRD